MKPVKKWLFPVLTCLIVAGAAVLPPRISEARDTRQFGQIHAEELAADGLPVREPPSLADRLTLYSYRLSIEHPVLSFEDYTYFEQFPQEKAELMQSVEDMLIEAGLIPRWVFEEDSFVNLTAYRILLWDPAGDGPVREPATFFSFTWANYDKLHNKLLVVDVDQETGLPISFSIFDTNISQWLPYEIEPARALSDKYFNLLGMEVREVDTGEPPEVWRDVLYDLVGTTIRYQVRHLMTEVTIEPDLNWHGADASGGTDG